MARGHPLARVRVNGLSTFSIGCTYHELYLAIYHRTVDLSAVLGAMVAVLPSDQPIPWPSWLKGLGNRLNPLLGGQRDAALKVGLLGAYLGRGLMLVIAHQIIR
jgi:hypothetical protein